MWMNRSLVCLVAGACASLIQYTNSLECEEELAGFIYPRIFTMMYDGPVQGFESKSAAIRALGPCISPEKHAENMINYFSSYGVNVSKIEQDPYAVHQEATFFLTPVHTSSSSSSIDRIVSGTFFDYTKYMNTQLHFMEFDLVANADTTGPRGSLKRGDLIYYSVFRFKLHGRDFCFQSNSRIPTPISTTSAAIPLDAELYNEYFGKGAGLGALVYNDDLKTTISVRYILTFPGNP